MFKRVASALVVVTAAAGMALAQGGSRIDFNGVGFDYPADLVESVHITNVGADPFDLGIPAHVQLALLPTTANGAAALPVTTVYVFQIAEFGDYPAFAAQLETLQAVLRDRPDLSGYTGVAVDRALPRLPPAFAAQGIIVKPAYVDNGVVSGIRYLTTYTQDPIFAITADRVEYTFQGISADGSRYIALITRLVTDALPAEAPADMLDDYPAYLARTVQMLNELDETRFMPALNILDSIALSLRVEGVSAPTVRPPLAETPSLGALGGTWTLVSYGDPSAPTPVLGGTRIELTIDSLGVSGSAGCNRYFGGYAYAENTISFAALGSTRMACAPEIMAQESAYLRALGSAETFEIVGNALRIVYAEGVLTFERG